MHIFILICRIFRNRNSFFFRMDDTSLLTIAPTNVVCLGLWKMAKNCTKKGKKAHDSRIKKHTPKETHFTNAVEKSLLNSYCALNSKNWAFVNHYVMWVTATTLQKCHVSQSFRTNFEFQESNGGVSVKIEGLRGIADGTIAQTSPLMYVQLTVPRGYVLTEDGSSAYELGSPLSEEGFSLDIARMGITINADDVKRTLKSGVEETGKVASSIALSVGDQETTNMLVNLGATTAILLGGATAVNMLAHHLTVNVFWVWSDATKGRQVLANEQ